MQLSRRTFTLMAGTAAVAAVALPLRFQNSDAGDAAGPGVLTGSAFGTSFRLVLPDLGQASAAAAHVGTIVDDIDARMSPYRGDSELTAFNRSPSTDWVPLSAHVRTVLESGLAIARHSEGAFDPTVGPLVARYGFGPIADATPGHYDQLQLGAQGLRKDAAGISIDLCGIAKGYALDLMVAALDGLGLQDYLLELGGEVFARGQHPAARAWQVAIERPGAQPVVAEHLLALAGRAVATSGDAAQFYEIDGRRYTHVIDPRTGQPVTGSVASVSVLAPSAMQADGWATALMAAGLERGAELAEGNGIDALFLVRDGATFKTVTTGRFGESLLA